jgi:hypothetical protein
LPPALIVCESVVGMKERPVFRTGALSITGQSTLPLPLTSSELVARSSHLVASY